MAKDVTTLAKGTPGTRECPYCSTIQKFDLVEEVPDEVLFKAHETNRPLHTVDQRGLVDTDYPLANFKVVRFQKHDGPCGLPCLSTYARKPPRFDEHPGQLCREVGCRGKIAQKQLSLVTGHHDGSLCPCNVPPEGDV